MSKPMKKPAPAPESYQPKDAPEIMKMAAQVQEKTEQTEAPQSASATGGSGILSGVPKVYYGAYGGITPFPICLKAVSDYLGNELDYTYALVASGGAFRLAWNIEEWDGGNVDIAHTYSDCETLFRNGITSLGRDFKILWREGNAWGVPGKGTKEDFKAFVKEQIDLGRPVISLGPIGPAEAGILTGYRDGGDTLLGWSLFQCDGTSCVDEGYFITDAYWDEGDFFGVMALGDITGPRFDTKLILENAVAALEGRQEGKYAKGIAAYDAWKKALLGADEAAFALLPDWGQSLAMACQGDATDCLADGRSNAQAYFKSLAEEHPKQPLYAAIAEQFGIVATVIHKKVYKALRGHQRGKKQGKALAKFKTRQKICRFIDEIKAADEKALTLMKELLNHI